MLYPESLKSRHIRKQSFKSVIKLVKHQFFLRSSIWWDWHLFNDSYMEWLWRPSDSFAIGFCIADLTKHNVFLAFWCSICCGYRPLNQQIDNIHSFIFCKDFAPSMKLPLVNKLQNNFKSRLECFVFVFRFLYYYFSSFFSYRNLSLTAVATSCMQTWATYRPTKTGRFTEHALPRFTLTSIIRLRERLRPDLNQGYQQCET